MAEASLFAAVAVISFVGGVGTLIPLIAALAGHPMDGWGRVPRVVTAVLLLVSLIAGIAAHRATLRANARGAASLAQPLGTETTIPLPATEPAPSPSSTSPTVTSQASPDAPVAKARSVTPRLRIADMSGASISQLVAAAKDLRHKYALDGVLQERTEQSPELQDLYTVHLTLNATVTQDRDVVAAFSLRSRGGGFQIEAARAQALDRLATALQERLAEVR